MKTTAIAIPIVFLLLGLTTGTWWPLETIGALGLAVVVTFAIADLMHRMGIRP